MYAATVSHTYTPLHNDDILLTLAITDIEGFTDNKLFIIRERLTNLYGKEGYSFETVATPVALVNYFADAPEERGGLFRVNKVELVYPTMPQAKAMLSKIQGRVDALCKYMDVLMDDAKLIAETHSTQRGTIEIKTSKPGLAFTRMVVTCDGASPIFIMQKIAPDKEGFIDVCPIGAESNYAGDPGDEAGWLVSSLELIMETAVVPFVTGQLLSASNPERSSS